MYKEDNGQISFAEFLSPFGDLDPNNRWVKIANMINWSKYEEKYKKIFCTNNGAPAINFRMAMGTLIIKQQTGCSDDDVLEEITENPYKQFLIGLHEFTTKAPFSQSSITNFRKYITKEMINEINTDMFRKNENDDNNEAYSPENPGDADSEMVVQPKPEDQSINEAEEIEETENEKDMKTEQEHQTKQQTAPQNKGTLMLDATCAPADIPYPTDLNLLNEAREKLETIIDLLYPHTHYLLKPRTYRNTARKEYLEYILNRKSDTEKRGKVIEGQLKYVKRNLKHIDNMLRTVPLVALDGRHQKWLETIRLLYEQQRYMFENDSHTVENRIVSIGQPHVRPIKRGKTNAPYEFGAKVSISLVDGYTFIDMLEWESYNEEAQLIPAVESYKKHFGYYPERVLADQIYRNRANRAYCKERGIRLSGPRLGRPPAETDKNTIKQQVQDSADRNAVEGKFGEGKHKYGLGRIMARIKNSCETVIALAFLSMNINRRLRVLLRPFFQKLGWCFLRRFQFLDDL